MTTGDTFMSAGLTTSTDFAEVGIYWEGPSNVIDPYWSPSVEDVIKRGRGHPASPEGIYVHALDFGTPQEIAAAAMNLPTVYGDAILRQAAGYGIPQNSLNTALSAAQGWTRHDPGGASGGGSGGGSGGSGGSHSASGGGVNPSTGQVDAPPGTGGSGGEANHSLGSPTGYSDRGVYDLEGPEDFDWDGDGFLESGSWTERNRRERPGMGEMAA